MRGNIEVRLNKDGSVDELLIYDKTTGECIFHMEQMDYHWFWMRAYGTEMDCVVHIGANLGNVPGDFVTDEEGRVLLDENKQPRRSGPEIGPKIVTDYEWEERG